MNSAEMIARVVEWIWDILYDNIDRNAFNIF